MSWSENLYTEGETVKLWIDMFAALSAGTFMHSKIFPRIGTGDLRKTYLPSFIITMVNPQNYELISNRGYQRTYIIY